jgi:hypothetical protein
MRYASIVRKALKALICFLTNSQCGNPVSHGTRQSNSPFFSRLSPGYTCLWLPQRRWCAVSILEDHLAGVVRGWWINSETCAEQPLHSFYRVGLRKLQDTERLLLWSRHFATRSPLAAEARNTFPRQLQTNFERFSINCCTLCDCRLTGYFIINMWNLLFELLCISELRNLAVSLVTFLTLRRLCNGLRIEIQYPEPCLWKSVPCEEEVAYSVQHNRYQCVNRQTLPLLHNEVWRTC